MYFQAVLTEAPSTIRIRLSCPPEMREVAIALLSDFGCNAFEEQDQGIDAYIAEPEFDAARLNESLLPVFETPPEIEHIQAKDWNAEWENNWQGVRVDDFCEVVPAFREPQGGAQYLIRIQPKMAFGTGHHYTTRLVMRLCRDLTFTGKAVLDMGTGTGILGILALKMGAAEAEGIDIDPWSETNAKENAAMNGCGNFSVILGDVNAIPPKLYDVIFANINRNILLEDGEAYVRHIKPEGHLLVSGFFDFDKHKVSAHFQALGLALIRETEEEGWIAQVYRKQ